MRDLSSYTVVGLGANASDDTVFLEKRVSYVAAIIQSAFGHLPESHKRFLGRELWDKLCPTPALSLKKGHNAALKYVVMKGTLRRILNLIFLHLGSQELGI